MAMGLNGHLANLGKLESFDYLIRGNEMISIGILLGTCAAKRGSMDILATKKISTQLEALLPPTATELPLSHTTQVAGLAGLGLLYQGTGHRHMAEVCLGELGRPPGPEMENCADRESYSLSAGLALGMITLGHGESLNRRSGTVCLFLTFCNSKRYEQVVENIPALHQNNMIQHGGFLMAMGMNGHLANLGKLESFDYLRKQIMTGCENEHRKCVADLT